MIAVTFALPAESSEFLRRLGNKSRADRNGISIVRGTIGHRSIEVIHTGVGENSCKERIGKFLENQQFDFLISAGFAGSLNHELQVNDLLVAKNFSTVDLKHASLSNVSIYAANILTVPALIDSSEERERIARESGASAVDMETEFIARACAVHGIPLLALRVITDTPTEPFPAPASVLFDIQTAANSHRRARQVFPRPSEAHAGSGSVREENFACTKNSVECAERRCARH